MNKFHIPEEVLLFHPNDLKGQILSYQTVLDCAAALLAERKAHKHYTAWDYDADILFQMTVVKSISIFNLSSGVNYEHPAKSASFGYFLDPLSIYNIVRAQFEAYCNFNNIYVQSKSVDELKLKYDLWVLAGLLNRQKFSVGEFKDLEAKKLKEQDQIRDLKTAISTNPTFLSLDPKSQEIITSWKTLQNDWKLVVNGNNARYKSWHELMTNASVNEMFEGSYRMLSLNTHPSNVSVFQFDQMYVKKHDDFNTSMALSFSKWILSFFIWDFVSHYRIKESFYDSLPTPNRNLITLYNTKMRPAFSRQ